MNVVQRKQTVAIDAAAAQRSSITPTRDGHSADGDSASDAAVDGEDAKVRRRIVIAPHGQKIRALAVYREAGVNVRQSGQQIDGLRRVEQCGEIYQIVAVARQGGVYRFAQGAFGRITSAVAGIGCRINRENLRHGQDQIPTLPDLPHVRTRIIYDIETPSAVRIRQIKNAQIRRLICQSFGTGKRKSISRCIVIRRTGRAGGQHGGIGQNVRRSRIKSQIEAVHSRAAARVRHHHRPPSAGSDQHDVHIVGKRMSEGK